MLYARLVSCGVVLMHECVCGLSDFRVSLDNGRSGTKYETYKWERRDKKTGSFRTLSNKLDWEDIEW